MQTIIIDTETSGFDAPHATEISYMGIEDSEIHNVISQRYNPMKPITLGAMAVTHICDDDVKDCQPHTSFNLPKGVQYLIGHNIDFDCQVLENADCDLTGIKRICTLAMARELLPDFDSHQLVALLYHFDREFAKTHASKAHCSAYDVIFTNIVFAELVRIIGERYGAKNTTIERIYDFSEFARIPKTMPFGKYKGVKMEELPKDYIDWALKNLTDIDQYLKKALEKARGGQMFNWMQDKTQQRKDRKTVMLFNLAIKKLAAVLAGDAKAMAMLEYICKTVSQESPSIVPVLHHFGKGENWVNIYDDSPNVGDNIIHIVKTGEHEYQAKSHENIDITMINDLFCENSFWCYQPAIPLLDESQPRKMRGELFNDASNHLNALQATKINHGLVLTSYCGFDSVSITLSGSALQRFKRFVNY